MASLPSEPQAILLSPIKASRPVSMPSVALAAALLGNTSTDRHSEMKTPPRMPQMRDTVTFTASAIKVNVSLNQSENLSIDRHSEMKTPPGIAQLCDTVNIHCTCNGISWMVAVGAPALTGSAK